MKMKSNHLYIDYLDHTVSGSINMGESIIRLRFDLLLFTEDILCLSVPACVKLESTARVLMHLTPFWKNRKIKLILDKKHQNLPKRYFQNRMRVLEKGFKESDLIHHFEYTAYTAPHADYFYHVFIDEVVRAIKEDLFVGKVFDTDETFRRSVIHQLETQTDSLCDGLPIDAALHMGKVLNDLHIISGDRKTLFQRTAIEKKLVEESGAKTAEISAVSKMLDRGFAYANGISSYAPPLSMITNRLTGRDFAKIVKATDGELYQLICNLSWSALYRLSINDAWIDFIDHLNRLLLLFQEAKRNDNAIFSPEQFRGSLAAHNVIQKIYELGFDALQSSLIESGFNLVDTLNLKQRADMVVEHVLYNLNDYRDIAKEIDEFIPALKIVIKSLHRNYRDSTILLKDQGFIISLDSSDL